MRTAVFVAMLAAAAVPVTAQERLADQLRKGVAQEEVSQNLDKAIQAYQAIVARYDEDRKAAGTALYRLAECYRKTGKREQAVAAYQRVAREFADQGAIAEQSRQQLAALGVPDARDVRPDRALTTGVRTSRDAPREVRPERGQAREVRPEAPRAASTDARLRQAEAELRQRQLAIEMAERRLVDAQMHLADEQKFLNEVKSMKQRPSNYDGIVAEVQKTEAEVQQLRTAREAAVLAYQQQKEESEARQREAQDQRLLNERLIKSVQEEIQLVQQRIKALEAGVEVGKVSPLNEEMLQLKRDLLSLQRKLDELRLTREAIR